MRILIANDDGFDSEGIRALVDELKDEYELYICAPDRQRSGASHSATYFTRDLRAERAAYKGTAEAWKLNGTPADCVYCAVCGLLKEKMDLVISGINNGPITRRTASTAGQSGLLPRDRSSAFLAWPYPF